MSVQEKKKERLFNMSNRNKTKSPSVSYEGFGGINKTSDHRSVSTAKEIVNFAVLKNGSLKKRCGTRMITETDGTIRAIHTPIIDGKQALFILSKNIVYGVHTEKGNNFGEKYSLGTIPSSENDSIFFTFDGSTYIADGEIYTSSIRKATIIHPSQVTSRLSARTGQTITSVLLMSKEIF